ncbi:leader peptidase (prepilin peptidase)/N-methyltransferase [Roseiarcus fermentans]|uniref:Leader peptidase (Prepilin peptidase)/N-methyltransferase n=2 Tax=Roseiarcus fermentans TaxID=1473586 RepID=A0A366ET13_9HYPH|nr:leader peptidase (prepilin peptidase)/N-methyltransferase [Roseiarcus fermentans]
MTARETGVASDRPKAGMAFECADRPPTADLRRTLSLRWSLAGAVVLLLSLAAAPGIEGALGGALGLSMLGVASADARRYVVPDALSGGAFALGVIHAAAANPDSGLEAPLMALARAAFAAGLFLLVRIAYRRFRRRDGLGLGDVKLAGAAGAWLSLPMLPIAIEIAALAALAAYVVRQRKRSRLLRAAGRVPFGAFFAPAIWLGWVMDTIQQTL